MMKFNKSLNSSQKDLSNNKKAYGKQESVKQVSDKQVSDKQLSDKQVSDNKSQTNKCSTNKCLTNKWLTNKCLKKKSLTRNKTCDWLAYRDHVDIDSAVNVKIFPCKQRTLLDLVNKYQSIDVLSNL